MRQFLREFFFAGIDRNDVFSWLYGFMLTIGMVTLGLIIGLGKVESNTSYGLLPVISILGTLAGAWSQTRFKTTQELKKKNGPTNGTSGGEPLSSGPPPPAANE